MLKVLIAEDDLMIADMLEEHLIASGYDVCGIARTVTEGLALAREHKPDIAVIDMRLADGGRGTELVAQFDTPRPAILYATGNTAEVRLTADDGAACITKPFRSEDLVRGLEIVADIAATGTTLRPFPHNFQLLVRRPTTPVEAPRVTDAAIDHSNG